MVCGLCGYAYVHSAKTSNHQLYKYYQCSQSRKVDGERPWCSNPSIRAQELEEAVWVEVCRLLKRPQNLQQEYQRRLHTSDGDPTVQTRKHLDLQMRKMNKGIERVIDAYVEGLIDKNELQPRLRTMRESLKSLEVQLKQLKDQATLESELRLVIGRVEEFAAKVTQRLGTLDFLEKREVIRTLVKRVEIYEGKVKVVFKLGNSPLASRTQTALENSSHCCERVDFIDSPRVTAWAEMAATTLVQLRSISLDPPEHS
ncbi:MAG TPA: zinc ribbon domain-containing protein [Candidatus Caenarcaniphilales bacterium]